MADPMKIRANMAGDKVEVKVLMSHEMETGQRKDAQGKVTWLFVRGDGGEQRAVRKGASASTPRK